MRVFPANISGTTITRNPVIRYLYERVSFLLKNV